MTINIKRTIKNQDDIKNEHCIKNKDILRNEDNTKMTQNRKYYQLSKAGNRIQCEKWEWRKVIMGLGATLPNHIPACRSEFLVLYSKLVFDTKV